MTNRQTNDQVTDQVVVNTAKMTVKKKLLIALCAVVGVTAIVATSVAATVAYLTASSAVSNVFTVGNVTISLTESKVNDNGTLYDGGVTKVDTNTYKLMDNTTYIKDPTITVLAGSENSYLFVLVRNDIETIEANTEDRPSIATQLAANGWAKYRMASTGWVYIYVGAGNVPAGNVNLTASAAVDVSQLSAVKVNPGDYKLFDTFSIAAKPSRPVSDFGAAKITITAYAIQDSGFATIDAAWTAILETYPYIHTGAVN